MTSVSVTRINNKVVVTKSDGTSVTVTSPVSRTVTLTAVGPQGPKGEAGASYIHQQTTASTTWTINHNLGFRPSVELLDSGSQEIEGEVSHPSVNQTVVTLNLATAGLARLT